MDNRKKSILKAQAKIIKSIAHPTRLFIVDELSKGEKCVRELKQIIEADMSTVSKHLLILKNAGIVKDEKRGCQIYYTLKIPCILDYIHCVKFVMKSNAKEHLALIK